MSSPLSPGQGVHKLGFQAGVADILWGSGSRVAGTSGGGARWSIWGYGISKGVICSDAGLAVLGGGTLSEGLVIGTRGRGLQKSVRSFLGLTGRSPASMLGMCSVNCFL